MSDVIWAAAIAGGVSVVGNAVTYLVSRRGAQTTVRTTTEQMQTATKTAEKHAQVELAKVEGELERLRREHWEAERLHRQASYHSLLQSMNRLDMYGTGFPRARGDEFEKDTDVAVEQLNALISGVHLFAPNHVRDNLAPLAHELESFGDRLASRRKAEPDEPYEHSFAAAWRMGRADVVAAEMHLIEAMRDDVTADD